MVKYCIEKYPMGSWKGQRSPGRFMDGWLYKNLEMMADKIVDDMTFLGIIYSSTLEVGTGKSVMATQIGEAWTEIINKKHNLNLKYDVDNIVWRPKDLIEKAFDKDRFPKYSYILLDEWEDSTYWSELGMTLRQFFRKCRQLNLFIMCIIPNWFQLPMSYAVSRSVFAIDVKFNNNLDRGFFSFYNFLSKRMLYVNGKRQHNYHCCKFTFQGRFPDGYGVNENEYRKQKFEDMMKYEEESPIKLTKQQIENRLNIQTLQNFLKIHPKASNEECSKIFGVALSTITRWKRGDVAELVGSPTNYNSKLTINKDKKEMVVDEVGLEALEKEKIGIVVHKDTKGGINTDEIETEVTPPTN